MKSSFSVEEKEGEAFTSEGEAAPTKEGGVVFEGGEFLLLWEKRG